MVIQQVKYLQFQVDNWCLFWISSIVGFPQIFLLKSFLFCVEILPSIFVSGCKPFNLSECRVGFHNLCWEGMRSVVCFLALAPPAFYRHINSHTIDFFYDLTIFSYLRMICPYASTFLPFLSLHTFSFLPFSFLPLIFLSLLLILPFSFLPLLISYISRWFYLFHIIALHSHDIFKKYECWLDG